MKPAPRKNHLAAIHIAHKALGLSKDDACALKQSVTGVQSAADMTDQQRRRYLAHLANLQAKTAIARGERPGYVAQRPQQQRAADDYQDERWHKARALWTQLAQGGVVHTNTDAALMRYVERQTHMTHWRFLNSHQINSVIEALKRWCARVEVLTNGGAHA